MNTVDLQQVSKDINGILAMLTKRQTK